MGKERKEWREINKDKEERERERGGEDISYNQVTLLLVFELLSFNATAQDQ